MSEKKENMVIALDALERLVRMFAVERIIYLVLTAASFLLVLYAAYLLIVNDGTDTAGLVSIFGASGLITASSGRISFFFNKAFNLIANLIADLNK